MDCHPIEKEPGNGQLEGPVEWRPWPAGWACSGGADVTVLPAALRAERAWPGRDSGNSETRLGNDGWLRLWLGTVELPSHSGCQVTDTS